VEHLNQRSEHTSLQKLEPTLYPEDYQQPEGGKHLWDYVHVILRRKWTAITFFLVTVTTVLVGTYMITPLYRASVTLKIEGENPFSMLFRDQQLVWQQNYGQEYMETQLKILQSKKLARRVIRAMGLDREKGFARSAPARLKGNPGEQGESPVRTSEDYVDTAAVDRLLSQVRVSTVPRTRLVNVSIDSPDPEFAARAVNEVARSYIGLSMENKFEATQQARDWLEKQLVDMRAKVERSEEALSRFASQNRIVKAPVATFDAPGRGADSGRAVQYDRLDELSSELAKATTERIGKEMLLQEAKQGDAMLLSNIAASPSIEALRKELVTKEAEYAKLGVVYKADYPKMVKLNEEVGALKKQIGKEAGRVLETVRKDYQLVVARENFLKGEIEKYKQEALGMNDKLVQYQILKRDADTNKELYNGILQRLKETGISASITTSNIVVLDKADVPRVPFKPDKKKNLMLALVIGALGGLGLAFFVEYLDNTVKSPDDIEKTIFLPSLGIVPYVQTMAGNEVKPMLPGPASGDKRSSMVEAYRSIGTYIQFSSPVRPPKIILVTSARGGEGKTTTCINLATSLANSSGAGVIIDCDLRKPQLHKVFNLDNRSGLTSYLTGHIDSDNNGLVQDTTVPNLKVIPSGIIPPNPSELLSSFRMKDLIADLFSRYSFVILDAPPILGLSDSLVLSTTTDGVIIVVRAGATPKESVNQVKKLLRGVNARILGVVLNGIRESDLRYSSYSYYYSYYYSESEAEEGKGKRGRRSSREKPSA
jgi:polysaccharide biosynthesis transport protein